MGKEDEKQLSRAEEYHLHVPKIPRQSIDVFSQDTDAGNYGLSARAVDTVLAYAQLQQTLGAFTDLTFSQDFLSRIPDGVATKLDQNLYPGISLAELEIPTTDKVLLTELLTADTLTNMLSESPVEVWITPTTQKNLQELGVSVSTGLQALDYGSLPLEAKQM